nr:MAG: hypothetical protein [Lake Baikal virophage 8]
MVHWKHSYKFGKEQELKIHPIIRDFFKSDIKHSQNQYDKYDFYDETTNYELKSRTNPYSKYPTTMITMNKCCRCDEGKELILLFNFTDGLYFVKFDDEQFKKYPTQMFSRLNETHDEKEHIYIPIPDLTLIQKWDNPPPPPALSKSGGF